MSGDAPALRVVRGDATEEELAALLAVLATRGATVSEDDGVPSAWGRPRPRVPLPPPGPGAWRRAVRA